MSKKPVRLRALPKGQKTAMTVLIILALILIVYGWARTINGVIKGEGQQVKQNVTESFEDLSDDLERVQGATKEVVDVYKTQVDEAIDRGLLKDQQELEETILSNVKEQIENEYGQEESTGTEEEAGSEEEGATQEGGGADAASE